MPIERGYPAMKRFGARYGRKLRDRFGKIEEEQRKKHKCPYCHKTKVKRISSGIWQCRSCRKKFAGKAYSVKEKITFEVEKEEVNKE